MSNILKKIKKLIEFQMLSFFPQAANNTKLFQKHLKLEFETEIFSFLVK